MLSNLTVFFPRRFILFLLYDYRLNIKYKNPTMIEEDIPYTNTGPATVNIFAPSPIISPSVLNSIAGEAMEFAKPVIGTTEPAPARLPMLSIVRSHRWEAVC